MSVSVFEEDEVDPELGGKSPTIAGLLVVLETVVATGVVRVDVSVEVLHTVPMLFMISPQS